MASQTDGRPHAAGNTRTRTLASSAAGTVVPKIATFTVLAEQNETVPGEEIRHRANKAAPF